MKKFIKLLLAGLLCVSLVGCSSSSSNSSDDDTNSDTTSDNSNDISESTYENSNVVTNLSGNVIASFEKSYHKYAFGTSIYEYEVKTVTFLDSFDLLPSDIDDESYDISENGDGCVMLYTVPSQDDNMLDIYIVGAGGVDANTNSSYLFADFDYCTSINFNDCFYTSNATDMSVMFYHCESLTSLDLSNFDTSNVTNMNKMFYQCTSLSSLDLSNFDTSNVTSMNSMFISCSSLSNLDISSFDTSNVIDMSYMFRGCSSLTDLDISSFDMSNVESDSGMFYDCPAGDNY
ncbi:MAG: DUF285 domain-containing protein [Erysipelotrichaceae bacterium]|nr:DUF285 domain-containing protein [Erysipelotrichaceae bacterium]